MEPYNILEPKQDTPRGEEFWKTIGGRDKYLGMLQVFIVLYCVAHCCQIQCFPRVLFVYQYLLLPCQPVTNLMLEILWTFLEIHKSPVKFFNCVLSILSYQSNLQTLRRIDCLSPLSALIFVRNLLWALTLSTLVHITEPGPQEEDELYEMYMAETNRVYRYENETLVPYEEYWGTTPKYEMLNNKAVRIVYNQSLCITWNTSIQEGQGQFSCPYLFFKGIVLHKIM